MQIINDPQQLNAAIQQLKSKGKTVGFVPTMGALHEGHLSLLRKAKRENHRTVCSIFVNPSQFNDKKDLKKYPRPIEKDVALLAEAGCHILFNPTSTHIYPQGYGYKLKIDLSDLDKPMEGKFRPGHFDGVIQVVKRLLEIVTPDRLYMGQKDFQQLTIIQHMVKYFALPVELVPVRTKREKDGLAMSSRNQRLEPGIRSRANIIRKTLISARRRLKTHTPREVQSYAMNRMNIPDFQPEYFEIVDGNNLKNVKTMKAHRYVVACTAVWAGEIRLIDNIICKRPN